MGLEQQIAAKLAELDRNYGAGVWGYDPERRTWFTMERGQRRYQNTDMGIPASVAKDGRLNDNGMIRPTDNGGGLLHDRAEWSQDKGEFVNPFSWDKLGLYGTLAALTAGTANAAMSGPTAASTYVPGAANVINPASTAPSFGMGAAPAVPGASGAAQAVANTAAAAERAAGVGRDLSASGIGADILKRITSPQGAAALTALLGMMANRGPSGGATGANSAQVNDLMNMTVDRAKRTDPLHQSITQLAMSRLPTSVQK